MPVARVAGALKPFRMYPRTIRLLAVPSLVFAAALAGCSSERDDAAHAAQREAFEAKRATHVVVTFSESNRVRVDNERFSPKELADVLKNKGRVYPGRPVLLLVQPGTKPEAATYVRTRAAEAGLGPVEVMVAE